MSELLPATTNPETMDDEDPDDMEALRKAFEEQAEKTKILENRVKIKENVAKKKRTRDLKKMLQHITKEAEAQREKRIRAQDSLGTRRKEYLEKNKANIQMDTEIYELERNHELERVARKQLELDTMKARREAIERLVEKRKVEISAIHQEALNRTESDRKVLERLLAKAETIKYELEQGQYTEKQVLAMANATISETLGKDTSISLTHEEEEAFSLVDQIQAERHRKYRTRLAQSRASMRKLNDDRAKIASKERKLQKSREKLEKLSGQGLDFLVQIELGNAPPVDLILKNLNNRDTDLSTQVDGVDERESILLGLHQDKEYDSLHGLTLDEVVDTIEKRLQQKQDNNQSDWEAEIIQRKQQLETFVDREREFIKPDVEKMEPYNGEFARNTYDEHQLPFFDFIMNDIILKLVDQVLSQGYVEREKQIKSVTEAKHKWESAQYSLDAQSKRMAQDRAVKGIVSDLVLGCVQDTVYVIFEEVSTLGNALWGIVDNMMLTAVAGSNHDKRAELSKIFGEVQKQRDAKDVAICEHTRIAPIRHTCRLGTPKLRIDHGDNLFEMQVLSRDAYQGNGNDDTDGSSAKQQDVEDESGDDSEDDNIVEYPVNNLPVLVPNLTDAIPAGFSRYEMQYWGNVEYNPKQLKVQQILKSDHFACICGSPDGFFLAAGTNKGCLYVWDLRSPLPILVRKSKPKGNTSQSSTTGKTNADAKAKNSISMIKWTDDSSSFIATLDESGFVRLYPLKATDSQDSKTVPFSKPYMKQLKRKNNKPASLSGVQELTPILELSAQDFQRPELEMFRKTKKTKKKRLFRGSKETSEADPLAGLEAMTIAFHCGHTMLGQQTSLLIGLENGVIVKWNYGNTVVQRDSALDPTVYATSAASEEPADPSGRITPSTDPRKITREFFQYHRAPITLIAFPNNGTRQMVSVDKTGLVCSWMYDKKHFAGFGWFIPQSTSVFYRLAAKLTTYERDDSKEPREVYSGDVVVEEAFQRRMTQLTQESKDGDPRLSKKEIGKEKKRLTRKSAREEEKRIEALNLEPVAWMTRENDQGQVMQLYAPKPTHEELKQEALLHDHQLKAAEAASLDKKQQASATQKLISMAKGETRLQEPKEHRMLVYSDKGILEKHIGLWYRARVTYGELCQVTMDPSGNLIAFVTIFASDPKRVRIYFADSSTLELVGHTMEIPFRGRAIPFVSFSPILGIIGSDYVYITMDGTVSVYSMTSGVKVTGEINPFERRVKGHLSQVIVSADHEHIAMVAPGDDNIHLYEVSDHNYDVYAEGGESLTKAEKKNEEQERKRHTLLQALNGPRRTGVPQELHVGVIHDPLF